MDAGLIMNIQTSPNISFNVNDYGFNGNKVHVDIAIGLLPTQFLAVQSELNTGIYEVLTHIGNEITINTDPQEPFCKSEFNNEPANGTVRAIKVSVIRGTSDDDDTIEEAKGQFAPLSYHKVLYDSKASGELGNIELTDNSDQIKLNKTTISAEGVTNRTHTIKNTADDEFTMNVATQTMTHKTMTDNSNNLISRALWVGSGGSSVSTYSATAPTTGQVLMANGAGSASFQNLFTISAGSNISISPSQGGGSTNTSITISGADNPENKDTTTETLEVTGPPGAMGIPGPPGIGIPGITTIVTVAGGLVTGGFVGGVVLIPNIPSPGNTGYLAVDTVKGYSGASGPTFVDGLITQNIYPGSTGPLIINGGLQADPIYYDNAYEKTPGHGNIHHNNVRVLGNCYLDGNVAIAGTLTTVNSEQLNVKDNYIYQNLGYTVDVGRPSGILSNTLPTTFSIPLSGSFVRGVSGISNSYVSCSDDPFYAGDIIQISGSDMNDGLYEVEQNTVSHLMIRGQHTTTAQPFTQKAFQNETITGTVYATKVNISGLEFKEDQTGLYYLRGNNADMGTSGEVTRKEIAYDSSSPSFSHLDLTGLTTSTTDALLVLDGTTVKKRSATSLVSSFTNVDVDIGFTVSTYPYGSGSTSCTVTVRTDPVRGDITCARIYPFSIYISSVESEIQLSCGLSAMPSKKMVFTILLYWDSNFEECFLISDPSIYSYRIKRKNFDSFPAGSTIKHCTQPMDGITPEFTDIVFVKF